MRSTLDGILLRPNFTIIFSSKEKLHFIIQDKKRREHNFNNQSLHFIKEGGGAQSVVITADIVYIHQNMFSIHFDK